MQIVNEVDPHLRLVNSEQYKWLKCASRNRNCDMKPDLFSAFHPLVEYMAPYENAPNCQVHRLFGKFINWASRSSIHCIWDAKWKIDVQGFGEKCKYLQIAGEDCVDFNGIALTLKGVLFDVEEFWMISSAGNVIVDVVMRKWAQPGSKQCLLRFLMKESDPWMKATNTLCERLNETILDQTSSQVEYTAFLGAGANGRVFKLTSGKVLKVVLERKRDSVEGEYIIMERCLSRESIAHLIFPIVEGSYRSCDLDGIICAGYLLQCEGVKISSPVTDDLMMQLVSALVALHLNDVIHGDPRIQNALVIDNQVKWIDFRDSELLTTKVSRRRDVEILFGSLGVKCTREEMEAYTESPDVNKLHNVIRRNR